MCAPETVRTRLSANSSVGYPEEGTPQGGVISPLLSNLYLHEVLDTWFEGVVKPRLKGRAFLVRYADDAVLGFEHEEDARRVMATLPKRFARYGLTLHEQKTRLIDFRRPDRRRPPPDDHDSSSFNMLGFTHFWARSRKGSWIIKRKTAKERFTRALRRLWEWCRTYRHRPVAEQHVALSRKLRGHYAYYGITGNADALGRFLWQTLRAWKYWLHTRSWKARMPWERFADLLRRYPLPLPRVVHSVYRRAANP
jgi:RNA-directed DNA polymerase